MTQATVRMIANLFAVVGGTAQCAVDTAEPDYPDLVINGFRIHRRETLTLDVGVTNQVLSFQDAVGILLISEETFGIRMAAGKTLLGGAGGLNCWFAWANRETAPGVHQTGVLLDSTSVNQALIHVLIVEAT